MSRKQLDRRALFSSAAAAALLAATGVAAQTPKRGGRLRLALSGASRDDSWLRGHGLFMQIARQGLVFETLTEVAADGTLHAELAIGWTSSQAAQLWQFELRQGVTFHDGRPFTSADVVASAAGFQGGTVTADGPFGVTFALTQPDAGFPLRLAQPEYFIRAAHAPDSGIGTGLYQVKDFAPGQRLLAERVSEHYKDGAAGWFDAVELASIPAEPVRSQALAEYIVDAADVTDAGILAGLTDIALFPHARQLIHATSKELGQPAIVSTLRPLDNLRAAQRWWFA